MCATAADKAARVRVVVKLVSSEGIGTIAVGVAKAGADLINVAGNTGGTGAAAVTSLKYTGRAAEIEEVVIDWLRQALGLPYDFTGPVRDTATTATLCAVLTIRGGRLSTGRD